MHPSLKQEHRKNTNSKVYVLELSSIPQGGIEAPHNLCLQHAKMNSVLLFYVQAIVLVAMVF